MLIVDASYTQLISFKYTTIAKTIPESGPGQDLDPMTHHTHFMESRLSVEHNTVVVLHVPLDLVADLKMEVTSFWMVTQINSIPVVSNNVFGSWVLVSSTTD